MLALFINVSFYTIILFGILIPIRMFSYIVIDCSHILLSLSFSININNKLLLLLILLLLLLLLNYPCQLKWCWLVYPHEFIIIIIIINTWYILQMDDRFTIYIPHVLLLLVIYTILWLKVLIFIFFQFILWLSPCQKRRFLFVEYFLMHFDYSLSMLI